MNVPKEYDDKAERLQTHPILLPKEDVPGTMSATDKAVLKKTKGKVSFAPCVSFAQQKSLRQRVRKMPKSQRIKTKLMPQKVTSPLVHRRSVLGDRDNRSAQVDKKQTEG